MTRKLLLFCVDQDRLREIRRLAQRMDIEVVRIERPSYWQKLGYLAKMTGFTEESRVYIGAEFPEEMMLMVGFGSRDLDWFLAAWKETGLFPVRLKAMATQTNLQWSPVALFQELFEEDRQMRSGS